MKPYIILLLTLSLLTGQAYAQDDSPYRTSAKVDVPITVAGMGLSYWGLTKMQDKEGLTEEEVANLSKSDVNSFDRFAAGYHSDQAKKISDIPFYSSFAMPLAVMILNDNVRSKFGQVALLYVETMAITGALFTNTNGNIPRTRPLVYNNDYCKSSSSYFYRKNPRGLH